MVSAMTPAECHLKAEALEQMILIVSYRPDRDRLSEQARYWRAEEAKALKIEHTRQRDLAGRCA